MSTEKPVALKPCPFCGCQKVAPVPVTNGNAMKCGECEATGPRTIFRGDEAAIYWNDRPTLTPEDVRRIAEKWAVYLEHDSLSANAAIEAAIIEALGGKNG